MSTPYAARRARLAAHIGPQAVAIVPTAPERLRNRDCDFPYRHDSYFYYLTGFAEPNAWLVVTGEGRSALFCQPRDAEREIWDGIRLGPQAAPAALGVDEAYSVDELEQRLPAWLEQRRALWLPLGVHEGLAARAEGWIKHLRTRARQGISAPAELHDVCLPLDEMRLIKDEHELALMRQACAISARAHVRAMQRSAAMLAQGQDVREHHLEAELLHEFRQGGAEFPAYGNIVAAGANACVLHYRAASAPIRAGEMVLIDAGCELHGYASDITRSFPANGRFTPAQRALYELVLAALQAAAAACRPGARFDAPHEAAVQTLTEGLFELGLLRADEHGSVANAIARRAYLPYYMHRTGHWLGMDVHDCGSYSEPGQASAEGPPPSRILRPGMTLTLEPGLYVRPGPGVPERFWNTGIRIEDDALITADGCELLTRQAPVAADEIEALMQEAAAQAGAAQP